MARIKDFVLLHALFVIYAISSVFGKYAANTEFLSIDFLLLYGASLAILFGYSIAWQFVLKRFSLMLAYANRGAVTVWGVLFGVVLFGELINFPTVIAVLLIVAGIAIIGSDDDG